MKTIGIDTNDYTIYSGVGLYGRMLLPQPTLLVANIFNAAEQVIEEKLEDDLGVIQFVFIDDGYDPVTRIRKGRIYQRYLSSQPQQWRVSSDTRPEAVASAYTFAQCSLSAYLRNQQIHNPVIALGNKQQFTLWSLVDIESTVANESVVYLKARKTFGALPDINYEKINESNRERVRDKINTLANEIHTGGPETVIDRCREALTAILSAYAQEHGLAKEGLDLGDLANALDKQSKGKKEIVIHLARTVARLHARGKNAVQEQYGGRPLSEQDAELAIQAASTVLYDLTLTRPISTLG